MQLPALSLLCLKACANFPAVEGYLCKNCIPGCCADVAYWLVLLTLSVVCRCQVRELLPTPGKGALPLPAGVLPASSCLASKLM